MAIQNMTSKDFDRLCRYMKKSKVFARNFDVYRARDLEKEMTFNEYLKLHGAGNLVMDYLYGEEAFSVYVVYDPETFYVFRIDVCGGHLDIDIHPIRPNLSKVRECLIRLGEKGEKPAVAILEKGMSYCRARLRKKEISILWREGKLLKERIANAQGD